MQDLKFQHHVLQAYYISLTTSLSYAFGFLIILWWVSILNLKNELIKGVNLAMLCRAPAANKISIQLVPLQHQTVQAHLLSLIMSIHTYTWLSYCAMVSIYYIQWVGENRDPNVTILYRARTRNKKSLNKWCIFSNIKIHKHTFQASRFRYKYTRLLFLRFGMYLFFIQ